VLAGDWAERWDMCVCSMTPTESREKTLAFPAIYRMSPATLVVRKDNSDIKQPADATGKTIGVKADTTYESYLGHDLTLYRGETDIDYVIDKPTIVRFPDKNAAMSALAGGDGTKLDGVVTSLAHAQAAIAEGMPVRIVDGFLFFETLAVTTEKGEEAFGKAIIAAVESMEDDGTLSELSMKWFGIDLTSQ
jgi:polar amino acid transport system substrate-binding protein